MEKRKTKIICDHCKGNGYLRESNGSYTEVHQCPTCNSQGEVVAEIYEQLINDGVVNKNTTLKQLKDLLIEPFNTIPEGATGKEIAEILEGDKKVTLQ
jgi:DnaJ-class molecular chaperone|tara:strand:+ start:749 stop:1042 length:294 start_codon:yes stop_codon:yes gene_type:complete